MSLSLSQFLLIAIVIDAAFGLGFLLAPDLTLAPLGVTLSAGGAMMTRIFGAALIAFAYLFWSLRDQTPGPAAIAAFRAAAIYNGLSAIPLLMGIVGGVANALAWLTFAIHVGLTAGFVRFGFRR